MHQDELITPANDGRTTPIEYVPPALEVLGSVKSLTLGPDAAGADDAPFGDPGFTAILSIP